MANLKFGKYLMETIIRKAEKSDTEAIFTLIQELAVYEREPDAVIINKRTFKEHGFGKKPLFKCFVAEINEKVVGIALFYSRYSTWKGKFLYLEDFVNDGIGYWPEEAKTIEEIVHTFKLHAASELVPGSGGKEYRIPHMFDIEYMWGTTENRHLNKIGTSALTSINIMLFSW